MGSIIRGALCANSCTLVCPVQPALKLGQPLLQLLPVHASPEHTILDFYYMQTEHDPIIFPDGSLLLAETREVQQELVQDKLDGESCCVPRSKYVCHLVACWSCCCFSRDCRVAACACTERSSRLECCNICSRSFWLALMSACACRFASSRTLGILTFMRSCVTPRRRRKSHIFPCCQLVWQHLRRH